MWWLMFISALQVFLFVELGLLFSRVMGNPKRSIRLGKSYTFLQGVYLWICRIVGWLFFVVAILVLVLCALQLGAVWLT